MSTITPRIDLLSPETDLCDAVNMADVAATLLENALNDKAAQEKITGKPNTF
jgi:hypothetical protein